MKPPADIIRQLLINLGLGTDGGTWPIYVSFLPDTPDDTIGVFDVEGLQDGRIMGTGEQIEHPGITVQIRAIDYTEGWEKLVAIANGLAAQRNVSVALASAEAYTVHNVSRRGALSPIGVEVDGDRRRHYFTMNATLTLSEE